MEIDVGIEISKLDKTPPFLSFRLYIVYRSVFNTYEETSPPEYDIHFRTYIGWDLEMDLGLKAVGGSAPNECARPSQFDFL